MSVQAYGLWRKPWLKAIAVAVKIGQTGRNHLHLLYRGIGQAVHQKKGCRQEKNRGVTTATAMADKFMAIP
jgi:hypothetical protein